MKNALYYIASVLIVLWAIWHFGFHAGNLVHLLLIIALIAFLMRIIIDDGVEQIR